MKYLNSYKDKLNEANLSKAVLNFKKGTALVLNQDFNINSTNYKESAVTWFGANIASLFNTWREDSELFDFKKGDVMVLFSENGKLETDPKSKSSVTAYLGIRSGGKNTLHTYKDKWNYSDMTLQSIVLAYINGLTDVVNYKDLDSDVKDDFISGLLYDKISVALSSNNRRSGTRVVIEDMEVTEITYQTRGRVLIKGFDTKTGFQSKDRLIDLMSMYQDGKITIDGKKFEVKPF